MMCMIDFPAGARMRDVCPVPMMGRKNERLRRTRRDLVRDLSENTMYDF